jgi:hypothetical protein
MQSCGSLDFRTPLRKHSQHALVASAFIASHAILKTKIAMAVLENGKTIYGIQ